MNNTKIELLAPAGSFDTLKTAINSGADAVYIGGTMFSARASANNFNNKEIEESIDYAHVRNVKIYLAINTLIKDNEINDCIKYISFLNEIGVDAIIVQDIGLTSIIRKIFPNLHIHFSTQATIASVYDINALKNFNIQRIVLPRETNIYEISQIRKNSSLEIEAFVHGALCVSYSGKCLFSALNGGRSGNRGSCAQVCRKKYLLEVEGNIKNDSNSKYILSPKDLNTSSSIDTIIKSGVNSLKIEGRMKRKEYIHVCVSSYRKLIDEYIQTGKISKESIQDSNYNLSKVFNRSFTKGYILNQKGKNIINNSYQKPIGEIIGQVIDFNPKQKKLKIKLSENVQKGDGLDIGENIGRIITKAGQIADNAKKGDIIYLDFVRNIEKNTIVRRTFDSKYEKNLEQEQKIQKKIQLNSEIILKIGKKPILKLSDDNINIKLSIDFEIQKSIKSPITNDDIIKQLNKTDTFPFELNNITINKDDDIFIPIKILNELRRTALEEFYNTKKSKFKREKTIYNTDTLFKISDNNNNNNKEKKIFIIINNETQLDLLKNYINNISTIISSDINLYKKILDLYPTKAVYNMPSIVRQEDINNINNIKISLDNPKLMFSSYGFISDSNAYIANYHLNIYNSFTHKYYNDKNIYTVSSLENIFANSDEYDYISDKSKIIIPVYIYPELMLTEFCPHKDDNGRCVYNYKCKLNTTAIINEQGDRFLFERFLNCKTSIISDKPYVLEKVKTQKYINQGYLNFLIQLKNENKNDIKNIIDNLL